jgi:DNA-binding transcriptional ArsR family regulator
MMNKKLLWWIFGVSKGGPMRARIVRTLNERPYNANQLAAELSVDYKTVRYHLDILLKNKIIDGMEEGNIVMYFLSDEMEKSYPEFLEIFEKLNSD